MVFRGLLPQRFPLSLSLHPLNARRRCPITRVAIPTDLARRILVAFVARSRQRKESHINLFVKCFTMSRLKLNKITVSNLNLEEGSSVLGGRPVITSVVACPGPILTITVCPFPPVSDYVACVTDRPGTQDSCGLCNPRPDIER